MDKRCSISFPVVFSNDISFINATGWCDECRNDSIAISLVAQQAVFKNIGHLQAVESNTIQVVLESSDNAESFQSSRNEKEPEFGMELSSGRLALTNISFLVSDAALASEDVLFGLPNF